MEGGKGEINGSCESIGEAGRIEVAKLSVGRVWVGGFTGWRGLSVGVGGRFGG